MTNAQLIEKLNITEKQFSELVGVEYIASEVIYFSEDLNVLKNKMKKVFDK